MKKTILTSVFMLIVMIVMTSCNSNNGKMFIVKEKDISSAVDNMGPSRFDTLFVHEQIQPDKSVKYTFEYRRWCHDIYTVEDCATAYDKHGKQISFSSFSVARSHIENIIDRIIEDNNVSEDDKSYVKTAYKQIYLNNYLPLGERIIYNLKLEIDRAKNGMVEDPEFYSMYKQSYDEDMKMLEMFMGIYPNVDTTKVYKLYE